MIILKSKRVAILGANGFLGAPIVRIFSDAGWKVFCGVRSQGFNTLYTFHNVDLFDLSSLKRFLEFSQPEVVISTAWETEHGKFWTKQSNRDFQNSTILFAEMCFNYGVKHFAALGTVSEYGDSPGKCNAKNTPLVSTDIYSNSKIATGLLIKKLGEKLSKKTNWFRIFQAFGPNEKKQRFIPSLIRELEQGNIFSINTPDYKLDWIHSEDIASGIYFSITNELAHFVDIGSGKATSVKDVASIICAELELDFSLIDFSGANSNNSRLIFVDPSSELFANGWTVKYELSQRLHSLGRL